MPALDLADADRLAYTALRRLDSGDHDRAAALRDALTALRGEIHELSGRWEGWRTAMLFVFGGAITTVGILGRRIPWDAWYAKVLVPPLAAVVLTAATLALLTWMSPGMTGRALPDPEPADVPGDLRVLLDRLDAELTARSAGKRPVHLELRRARIWSLAHGGPAPAPGGRRVFAWRTGVARSAACLHWLVRRDAYAQVEDGERGDARHRLAALDLASRLLRRPWTRWHGWAYVLGGTAAYAALTAWQVPSAGPVVYALIPLMWAWLHMLSRWNTERVQWMPPRRLREDSEALRDAVRANIAARLERLPDGHPAVADLRLARDLVERDAVPGRV